MTGPAAQRPGPDERLAAEREERRRLAELLHDGPVQHLAAIAQMLDAAGQAIGGGDHETGARIVARALEITREASGDLREIVAGIEPVSLDEHGFGTAVRLLADRIRARREIAIHVDVDAADRLGDGARTALYQIVRESLDQAVRRGPPTEVRVTLRVTAAGGAELLVADNGAAERRQIVVEGLAQRAADVNADFAVERKPDGWTVVRVTLPPSAAHL